MRSNIEFWAQLQDDQYFERHPCYNGLVDMGDGDRALIEQFVPLSADMNVVVIGCGYGRESAHIAPKVRLVYGIDVSMTILAKAAEYVKEKQVSNFIPVLADSYQQAIPSNIQLVYSMTVMQHITRDLVRDYFASLGSKLSAAGRFVVQFIEDFGQLRYDDAELRAYEPRVSWTLPEISELCRESGLRLEAARSHLVEDTQFWHWICAAPVT